MATENYGFLTESLTSKLPYLSYFSLAGFRPPSLQPSNRSAALTFHRLISASTSSPPHHSVIVFTVLSPSSTRSSIQHPLRYPIASHSLVPHFISVTHLRCWTTHSVPRSSVSSIFHLRALHQTFFFPISLVLLLPVSLRPRFTSIRYNWTKSYYG